MNPRNSDHQKAVAGSRCRWKIYAVPNGCPRISAQSQVFQVAKMIYMSDAVPMIIEIDRHENYSSTRELPFLVVSHVARDRDLVSKSKVNLYSSAHNFITVWILVYTHHGTQFSSMSSKTEHHRCIYNFIAVHSRHRRPWSRF